MDVVKLIFWCAFLLKMRIYLGLSEFTTFYIISGALIKANKCIKTPSKNEECGRKMRGEFKCNDCGGSAVFNGRVLFIFAP